MSILDSVIRKKADFFEQSDFIKRQTILSYIAQGYKFRFYEYDTELENNIKENPTARAINLGLNGRDGSKPMTKHIEDIVENVGRDEFSEGIIGYTVEAIYNLAEELKISNNETRRKKFFNALNNLNGQRLLLFIGVLTAAKHCVKNKIDINHQYLDTVIRNADENKVKISKLFKEYHNDNLTVEELNAELEDIYTNFKDRIITLNGKMLDRTAEEKALLSMFEENDIQIYLMALGEEIRVGITKQLKLF